MRYFYLLFVLCFVLASTAALAQRQFQLVNPDFGATPLEARPSSEDVGRNDPTTDELVFFYYPYTSSTLNLRHFRSVYPHLRDYVPDSLRVEVPDLSWAKEVSYVVGYLSDGAPEDGALLIFLLANYNQPLPVFLFDTNLDRSFLNENNNAYIFDSPRRRRKRTRVRRPDGRRYSFYLLNPADQREVPVPETARASYQEKIEAQLTAPAEADLTTTAPARVQFHLLANGTTGYGKIKYFYNTSLDGNSYTNYRVRYNPIGVGLVLEAVIDRVSVRLEGAYHSLEYQNSILDAVSTTRNVDGTLISQSDYRNNFDRHPGRQLVLGGRLGYYLPLSPSFAFLPSVGAGRFWYDTPQYVANKENPDHTEPLSNFRYWGGGLAVQFTASPRLRFLMEGFHTELGLRPRALYDRLATEGDNNSFRSSHRLTYVNMAVKIALGKR